MNFQTQYNRTIDDIEAYNEINVGASLTVPDQSLSIREIIARNQAGIPLTGERIAMYYDDEEMPDLKKMDLSEIHELQQRNQATMDRINKELYEKDKAKKDRAYRDRLIEEHEKKRKSETTNAAPSAAQTDTQKEPK